VKVASVGFVKNNNIDDLLVALYVHLDDFVLPAIGWSRDHLPGRKPVLNDTELLCLVIAQHLLQIDSERRWIRYARKHYKEWFPNIPGQSGYGKRVRCQGRLIAQAIRELAVDIPSWHDVLRLVDSTPVPCAASRESVKRSELAGEANYGYCASHSRYFWGYRLYLIATPDGVPVLWALADPKIGERDVVRAMIENEPGAVRAGSVLVGDKGFAGRDFEQFVSSQGITLVRPDKKNEQRRFGKIARVRQWVEAVFDTLKGQLGLERHGGRTPQGVYARVASKLLALTAAVWNNWRLQLPTKRSLIAYDH
jgi:hypothetical protein